MICSGVIVAMDAIRILTGPFKPILSGILSLSDQGSFCLMSGLLCGYPMGAKTTSDFLDQGRLSVREGKYLLAISNHPSPMFVLGYVMAQIALIPSMASPCRCGLSWQPVSSHTPHLHISQMLLSLQPADP